MDVASAEFVSHGYAEANVARIAAEAGVSKKTIYGRYPTKDQLLIAVVGELAERSNQAIVSAMAVAGENPKQALTSFGGEVARNWRSADSIGFYRLVIAETPRFPELATLYRDAMKVFAATLADYLRRQCELGSLTISEPERAAHEFGMLAYGEVREKALLGEPVTDADIDEVVTEAVRLFLLSYAVAT